MARADSRQPLKREGLIMRILIADDSVLVHEQLKAVLRRLIPRLLGFVFLAMLGAVALSRCAVFTTLAYLVFER
jgi:hypothetical protein